jgi:23S rRNA pseudouridine1911/1915/1917 synthase
MTLRDRLRLDFPTAKQQTLKRMVGDRRVRVNGELAKRLDQVVNPDDRVTVTSASKDSRSDLRPPFEIMHEDRDILVVIKPAGLLTSTTPRERRPTLIAAVRDYLQTTDPSAIAGLIHRLDRDSSGLLVFSKNREAFVSLKMQFFHHAISRIYHAIVSPSPKSDSGRIENYLLERADGSVHSTRSTTRGQRAVTLWDVANRRSDFALLRVQLHTGRKHQIRAHLSESGYPILGDTQYGGKSHKKGLMLVAVELAFDHPRSGKRMVFSLPKSADRATAIFMAIGPGSESL